jgi:hypothetical protein
MLIVTDDGGGITDHSLQAWHGNREFSGAFVQARVYARADHAGPPAAPVQQAL